MSLLGEHRVARRTILGLLAFVAPAALVLRNVGQRGARLLQGAGNRSARETRRGIVRARPAGPEVLALFGDLRAGTRVGDATLVAIHDVHFGAIPVLLRLDDGHTFQVDVVARSTTPGVISTPSLTLHMANRADGELPTHERAGLATMALGRALAAREAASAVAPRALLTHAARQSSFPLGRFAI